MAVVVVISSTNKFAKRTEVVPKSLELSASGRTLPVIVALPVTAKGLPNVDVASVIVNLLLVALSSIPVDAKVVIVPPPILFPVTLG